MKTVAIIQARMNSSRLPSKVMFDLCGKPVIEHIVNRVRGANRVDEVCVATTVNECDLPLVEFLEKRGISVYRGSEDDVLDRYYQAALVSGAEVVVRITADDPLKDPEVIDMAVENLLKDPSLSYCSNTITPTFPEGLDVEAFRFSALEKAWNEAKLQSEREHATPYIWKNPDKFKALNFTSPENFSHYRWTLDYPNDFKFMERIYGEFYREGQIFSYRDILKWLAHHPEVVAINSEFERNAGYKKSLAAEAGQTS